MKNLFFAGLVVLGLSVIACGGKAKSESPPVVTFEPAATATTIQDEPTPTVVKPSLPCYTASDDSKLAIIKALPNMASGYALDVHTFKLWVDGSCMRGTFDWSLANSFVEAHPDASPSEIPETPNKQLASWEELLKLPVGSLNSNVYWVSGVAPSVEVCHILDLRCED